MIAAAEEEERKIREMEENAANLSGAEKEALNAKLLKA